MEVAAKVEASKVTKRRVSVSGMLKFLGVSRSGYRAFLRHKPSASEQRKHAVKKEGNRNGAFSTFKISSYPGNFLNAGQCIFAIDSTAGATWMGSEAPNLDIHKSDIVEFETVVRPIPQYDVNNPQMISQGPSVCIFNKADPQEVLASWIFVQFLLTNEVQLAYSGNCFYGNCTAQREV